jgi:hypothetical protein
MAKTITGGFAGVALAPRERQVAGAALGVSAVDTSISGRRVARN